MILVTGGSGVLGRALVEHLISENRQLVVLSSSDGDLRDSNFVYELFSKIRPKLVFHLAAKVHGLGGNTLFPGEMFSDNVRINLNVIDAARRTGCEKIVAASTVAIYSSEAAKPISEEAVWSGAPHASEMAYGHAKRAMLAQLEAYARQYGMHFAYPILTNIYGPHDRFDIVNGHVIPSLISKFHAAATRGGAVEIWGTGRAQRDFIHAADAAAALIEIARSYDGAINVASGKVVAIKTVVELLSEISGVAEVTWDSTKPDGQLERLYDVGKLQGIGFSPAVGLREGLEKTYSWYCANFPNVRS